MALAIETIESAVAAAEEAVVKLERLFERPELVQIHDLCCFRHIRRHDLLMSYLKCVRSVSSLNACLVLLRHGYVQEIGVLCRCIDDNNQDVIFLATPLGANGKPSDSQERMVKEFYQEEFNHRDPLLSTQKRDRVSRQKVQAEISRMHGQPLSPHKVGRVQHCLSNAFSGYVHSAYVHIMEMYGGVKANALHYHMHGLLGTPRIAEWTKMLPNYVYRTMIAIEMVAKRCGDEEVEKELEGKRIEFERVSGIGKQTVSVNKSSKK